MQPFEDEIWNERQWEQHLSEMEDKSEKLRTYIETNLGEQTPRWSRFLNGFQSKLDAIDAYIEDELMFEDAYFPDDEDDWDDEDDEIDDFFMSAEESEEDEDMEDGEEWKKGLDAEYFKDSLDFNTGEGGEDIATWIANEILNESEEAVEMQLYDEARELAADMLRLAEIVPKEEQEPKFVEFITGMVNVSSRIAGAFAFGFDLDVLGGNIAYCRRALNHANQVLELLQELKDRPFIRFIDYEALHERVFDLRNDLGVHIQELREELNEGLKGNTDV